METTCTTNILCGHQGYKYCWDVSTDLLPWKLHALQTYYVAIKTTNTVGMFVIAYSEKYQDSVARATTEMVYDVDIDFEEKVLFSDSKLDDLPVRL